MRSRLRLRTRGEGGWQPCAFASARSSIATGGRGADVGRRAGPGLFLFDPSDAFIPVTDIPRLRLVHLGGKSVGVDDDDTSRVIAALQDFHATRAARRAAFAGKKKNPPQREPWWVR